MSELKEKDGEQEMAAHLSSIQNSVDSTIQGLGNRNKLFRTSSDKFFKVSNDLNGRLATLQEYSSALCLKKKEIKDHINLFYQEKNEQLKEIKQNKLNEKKKLESLEERLTQISNQIAQNQQNKENLSNQILSYDKEDEELNQKSLKYQEISNMPAPPNRNDEIIDSIQEAQKSLKQIEEKIQLKLNSIQKFQNSIQILQPIHQISKSLNNTNEKYAQAQEEEYSIQKKIEIQKSISQEKQEALNNLLSQIKENNHSIDLFRKNLTEINTINTEIVQEKEKESHVLKDITPIEYELRLLDQEYDAEIKNEIKIAHEFNEVEEKIRNRDPNLLIYEKKMIKLEKNLAQLLQKKDDLLIIGNGLQNEIDQFDHKTMLMKEKFSKEISEGAVFYEQKLYKELRKDLIANDNLNKDIDELLMMINVLEAEKKRLHKKIVSQTQKYDKYKEKIVQLKKLNSKNKFKSKLNELQFSIEALQFKINELLCINEHKKEDIQTKNLRIEQTLFKFIHPFSQECISKTNILNPIVPILNKRSEAAKKLYKTALYVKKMFQLQKNAWKDINPDEIKNTFERWEDTLDKEKPSIEKNILRAFIELVC